MQSVQTILREYFSNRLIDGTTYDIHLLTKNIFILKVFCRTLQDIIVFYGKTKIDITKISYQYHINLQP